MRRPSLPRVLWHLLAYAAVLAGLSALVPLDASFGSDDGAYGGQVWALRQGSWVLDRPLPVVAADHEAWLNGAIVAEGPVPYSTSPVWVHVLAASAALVHGPGPSEVAAGPVDPTDPNCGANAQDPASGATHGRCVAGVGVSSPTERAGDLGLGLHLPGLLAALAAAAAAWRLAGRWDPRAAPAAFWLVALSPMLVDTTTLWAHTLGSACGGWAVVAVAELWHRRSPGWALVLAAALALGAAVRTEAVFWTAAVVVSAMLADRSRTTVVAALSGGAIAAATWAAARAWGASLRSPRLPVETSVEALRHGGGWLASRLPAAWQVLATWPGAGPGQALSLAALVAAAVAVVLLVRARGSAEPVPPLALAAAGASAVLLAAKAALAPDVVIPGVVAAWPAVFVALAAGRWRVAAPTADRSPVDPRWLLAPVGLLTLAVLATQYESSGGLQWGGRYLSMAYVPLAAAAAITVAPVLAGEPTSPTATRDGSGQPARRGRHLAVALAALAVAPAISGGATSLRLHTTHAMIVELTTTPEAEVVITDLAALPRIGWTALPTTFYRADADTLAALLADLAATDVESVNVAGMTEADVDGVAGWHLASTNQDPHGTVRHLTRHP